MLGVQEAKIRAILDIPVPATKKKLMSFLGSTGYYRRFIPNYSTVAAKLSDLTKKALPDKLTWLPVHQEAFDKLKKALSEAPVLTPPDLDLPFWGCTGTKALRPRQADSLAIYLLGSKTTVYTDHKALTFLKTMKNSSPRVARWWVELQQYDLEVCYRRGADNVVADMLSRDFSAVDPAGEQVHSPKGGGGVGTRQTLS